MRSRALDVGFRVKGCGLRVWDVECKLRVEGIGLSVEGLGLRV